MSFYTLCEFVETNTCPDTGALFLNSHPAIWMTASDLSVISEKAISGFLTEAEKVRSMQFFRHQDTAQYVMARVYLRFVLKHYYHFNRDLADMRITRYGKPFFLGDKAPQFNISHSRGLIAIGIAPPLFPIGVDLEYINPDFDYKTVLETTCSPEERDSVMESVNPLQQFYVYWTRKEALLKGLGTGLTDQLNRFSCIDGVNTPDSHSIKLTTSWSVRTFPLNQSHILSVALPLTGTTTNPVYINNDYIENWSLFKQFG